MTGKPYPEWTFVGDHIVHRRAFEMVDDAYGCGQPFMDDVVMLLLKRGARTPEQKAESLREGLLRESYRNPMLTWSERKDIWRRYHAGRLVRLAYRIEAWRRLRRLRRAGVR